ncbi:MAG: DUF2341 domain-containing protein [Candidatus Micrarchaeia archaeon]|jgi:hypothetical protein
MNFLTGSRMLWLVAIMLLLPSLSGYSISGNTITSEDNGKAVISVWPHTAMEVGPEHTQYLRVEERGPLSGTQRIYVYFTIKPDSLSILKEVLGTVERTREVYGVETHIYSIDGVQTFRELDNSSRAAECALGGGALKANVTHAGGSLIACYDRYSYGAGAGMAVDTFTFAYDEYGVVGTENYTEATMTREPQSFISGKAAGYNYYSFRGESGVTYAVTYKTRQKTGEWWAAYSEKPFTEIAADGRRANALLDPWWNSLWDYARPCTITTGVASSLTNFPAYCQMDTATPIAAERMNSSCWDLRVLNNANTTELLYEVENGTCNTAQTIIWFLMNTTGGGNDTVWFYYGNPAATSAQNNLLLWNRSNYSTVIHFGENGTLFNSAGGSNLTSNDTNKCYVHFANGTRGMGASVWRCQFNNTGAGIGYSAGETDSTETIWYRYTSHLGAVPVLYAYGAYANYQVRGISHYPTGATLRYETYTVFASVAAWTFPVGINQHYATRWQGSNDTAYIFRNGTIIGQGTYTTINTPVDREIILGNGVGNKNNWGTAIGNMDEFRIRAVASTNDWIMAEYLQSYYLGAEINRSTGVIAITSPENNTWTSDTTPEINFSINNTNATKCWYRINGGGYTELSGKNTTGAHLFNTSIIAEGMSRNVTVTCEFEGVNASSTLWLKVDASFPWMVINSPANGTYFEQHSTSNITVNYTLRDSIASSAMLNSTVSLNGNASNPGTANWCNTSFMTRTNLTSGAIPENDYQVNFSTSSPESLSCLQANYSDIRVYFWNGSTCSSRPFDIVNSNSTYLEMVVNATNVSGTHYIYCGNSTAASIENPGHTYLFFDDFPAVTMNASKWNLTGSGYISIYSGAMQFYSSPVEVIIKAVPNMTLPSTYRVDFIQRARANLSATDRNEILELYESADAYLFVRGLGGVTLFKAYYLGITKQTNRAEDLLWHEETLIFNGTYAWIYENGTLMANNTMPANVSSWYHGDSGANSYLMQLFDDVRVRKYSASEPEFILNASEDYVAPGSGAIYTHTLVSNGSNYQEDLSTPVIGWNNITAEIEDVFFQNSTNISVYYYSIVFSGFTDSYVQNGSTETIYAPIYTQGDVSIANATAYLRLWNGSNETVAGALSSGDNTSGTWSFDWTAPATGGGQVNYTIEALTNATPGTSRRNSTEDYFVVDNGIPELDCTLGNVTNFITPEDVWFNCTANDSASVVSSVEVYVNDTLYSLSHASGTEWNYSVSFSSAMYGNYSVYAVATDSVGNTNTTATTTFTTSKVTETATRTMTDVNFTLAFPQNYTFNASVQVAYNVSYTGTSTALAYNETYAIPEAVAVDFACNSTNCFYGTGNVTFNESATVGGQDFLYQFNFTIQNFTINTTNSSTIRFVNVSRPSYVADIGDDSFYLNLSFTTAETWTGGATDYLRIRTYDTAFAEWTELNLNPAGGDSAAYGIYDYYGYDSDSDSLKDTANVSLDLAYTNFVLRFDKQSGTETGYSAPVIPPVVGGPGGGGGTTTIINQTIPEIIPADIMVGSAKIDDILKGLDGWMKTKPNALLLLLACILAYYWKRKENISALFAFGIIIIVSLYWSVLI